MIVKVQTLRRFVSSSINDKKLLFQLIPEITSLTPITTALPLFGVLSLTAIKYAYDDVVSWDTDSEEWLLAWGRHIFIAQHLAIIVSCWFVWVVEGFQLPSFLVNKEFCCKIVSNYYLAIVMSSILP